MENSILCKQLPLFKMPVLVEHAVCVPAFRSVPVQFCPASLRKVAKYNSPAGASIKSSLGNPFNLPDVPGKRPVKKRGRHGIFCKV